MRTVQVETPEALERLVSTEVMGFYRAWMGEFNLTKAVLLKCPMEIGPTDHGWYSAAPGTGDIETRLWHVKARTPEWAICAGALASKGINVQFTGEVPVDAIPV